MTPLREVQELFFRSVRSDPAPPELESIFAPSSRLSARDCMGIYRTMYWYRLVDALFDVFPRLAEHLGRERFTRLASRYLAAHPSSFPELERVGHAFARFIEEASDADLPDARLLSELARLEYTGLDVLLAPSSASSIAISAVDSSRFPFQSFGFMAALGVVHVGDDALAAFEGAVAPERAGAQRSTVLFWRRRFAVRHRVLAFDEAAAFTAALGGRSVEEVCASFTSPERAARVLSLWFEESLVISLSEPS